ncbi:MAG: helix-turn-helix transcriptional regulator [Actinobacteria bacterium]|nr:helix-turn-helix transcriptional regulator [Actinomycetota bacterium]MBI3686296.1 helix-turn-helix transcriptional regulator [Actinomycetota bacterium]
MNAIGFQREHVEPAEWDRPEMRAALAARDITKVYRLLQRIGFSQQRIAALTGQSQPEVSAIIHGRKVMAYDVLARIADGLGVPRGYMGLAYAQPEPTSTPESTRADAPTPKEPPDDTEPPIRRRAFLGQAAAITLGAAVLAVDPTDRAMAAETPVPARIGAADVDRVTHATASLRSLDYRYGGGSCRSAVLAQLRWTQRLTEADCSEEVGRRLRLALADLHNLAGWTSLDVGLDEPARQSFLHALQLARLADDPDLVANILYRTGRISLHRGDATEALRLFRLGQLAAEDADSTLPLTVLAANMAWAHGHLGDVEAAERMLDLAEERLAQANLAAAPPWFRFFDESDLEALRGVTYLALGESDPRYTERAIGRLTAASEQRLPEMARSRAFDLTSLATAYLRHGEVDHGIAVAERAVAEVSTLTSARVIDKLRPLAAEAAKRPEHADARDLVDQLTGMIG